MVVLGVRIFGSRDSWPVGLVGIFISAFRIGYPLATALTSLHFFKDVGKTTREHFLAGSWMHARFAVSIAFATLQSKQSFRNLPRASRQPETATPKLS